MFFYRSIADMLSTYLLTFYNGIQQCFFAKDVKGHGI